MSSEEKITKLSDIAEELGLSVSTVSRALSGNGRVGKATRDRVQSFMEDHNYQPNMLAKGLANGRSYNICAVLPSDTITEQVPFFYECLMGICSEGMKSNYSTIVTTDKGGIKSQLESYLKNGKADGYILLRAIENDPSLRLLRESGFPLVVVGSINDKKVAQVDEDHYKICKDFALDILKKDFLKPVLISGDLAHTVNRSRKAGFLAAVDQAGLGGSEVVLDGSSHDSLLAAAAEIEKMEADCVFCGDDYICVKLLELLKEKKPFVASFYYSEILAPSGIKAPHFDAKALGKKAADRLLGIIDQ